MRPPRALPTAHFDRNEWHVISGTGHKNDPPHGLGIFADVRFSWSDGLQWRPFPSVEQLEAWLKDPPKYDPEGWALALIGTS